MSKDPEMGSLAGIALWRAMLTFDQERGVPLKRWIALCVRRSVWCYWRKLRQRREEFKDDVWWEYEGPLAPEWVEPGVVEDNPDLTPDDWQLLVERFILHWPMDVLARRRGITMYRIKRDVAGAIARLSKE